MLMFSVHKSFPISQLSSANVTWHRAHFTSGSILFKCAGKGGPRTQEVCAGSWSFCNSPCDWRPGVKEEAYVGIVTLEESPVLAKLLFSLSCPTLMGNWSKALWGIWDSGRRIQIWNEPRVLRWEGVLIGRPPDFANAKGACLLFRSFGYLSAIQNQFDTPSSVEAFWYGLAFTGISPQL